MSSQDSQSAPDGEGAAVETLNGSSAPSGKAPVFTPITGDAELITLSHRMAELGSREDRLRSEGVEQTPELAAVDQELEDGLRRLKAMPAGTAGGIAAKARAVLEMHALFDSGGRRDVLDLEVVRSLAEDAVRLGHTAAQPFSADAALIAQGRLVEELSDREHALFGREPSDEDPAHDEWRAQTDTITEEFRASIEKLAAMSATTAVGLAAKGAATLKMRAMFDYLSPLQEVDLVRSLAENAVGLAAAQAPAVHPDDAELFAEIENARAVLRRADRAMDARDALINAHESTRPKPEDGPSAMDAWRAAAGLDAEKAEWNAALDACGFIWPRVSAIRARTLAGMQAKVSLLIEDDEQLRGYRTWLSNEYRSLTAEMYPDHPEMAGTIAVNNAGDKFHFRGEPPASTRAERMLAIFGLDWTQDRPSGFSDQQAAA